MKYFMKKHDCFTEKQVFKETKKNSGLFTNLQFTKKHSFLFTGAFFISVGKTEDIIIMEVNNSFYYNV